MNDDLVATLRVMNEATDLIEDVLKSVKLDSTGTTTEQLTGIKAAMAKPEWRMTTTNTVEGIIAGEPVKLRIDIDFNLDTRSLFRNLDRQANVNQQSLQATLTALKNQPNGDALAEILLDSLWPHAYGLTTRIEMKENLAPLHDVGLVEEAVQMIVKDGIVHFHYAPALSRFLPPAINLDAALMQRTCWVNVEFFRGREGFSKDFFYQDEGNGQPLSVSLKVSFIPLT